jgi:hypothetical protein
MASPTSSPRAVLERCLAFGPPLSLATRVHLRRPLSRSRDPDALGSRRRFIMRFCSDRLRRLKQEKFQRRLAGSRLGIPEFSLLLLPDFLEILLKHGPALLGLLALRIACRPAAVGDEGTQAKQSMTTVSFCNASVVCQPGQSRQTSPHDSPNTVPL